MEKTFWAPKPNCDRELNDEDKQFLDSVLGSRKGRVSFVDRVAVAKYKRKLQMVLKVQQRTRDEEQRKMDRSHPFSQCKV